MKKSNFIVIGLLAMSMASFTTSCSRQPQQAQQNWNEDDDDYRSDKRGYYHGGIFFIPGMAGYSSSYHRNSLNRGRSLRSRGYKYGNTARSRAAAHSRAVSRSGFSSSSRSSSSYGG